MHFRLHRIFSPSLTALQLVQISGSGRDESRLPVSPPSLPIARRNGIAPAYPAFSLALMVLFVFAVVRAESAPPASAHEHSISGTVKDKSSGELLIGASVVVEELKGVGASTNAYGFYSLTLPEGKYHLQVQYLGYQTVRDSLSLTADRTIGYALTPVPITIGEVVVSGERTNQNVVSTQMSTNKIEVKDIKAVPVLLGERDILKTIQLLPGIKSAGEGNTGFYARGGGTDQNLILLDEAPIYNSAHLLGYVSIFNSDAIKDVTVMTGAIPAEYGGRLSSVLDIRTDDGNAKTFGGTGGIGLLDSRLTFEGPIVKDEGSFIISGRRTYADLFLHLSRDTTINRTSLYFYDLNMKANYAFGEKDRVFASAYFGRDNFNYPNVFGFNWGNTTGTLRWNHIFGENLFSNTSLIYSDYSYANTVGAGQLNFVITSGIRDYDFKTDFQYFLNTQSTMKFGINAIYHTFYPGNITSGPTTYAINGSVETRYATEDAAYFSHEFQPVSWLKLAYGVRGSLFSLLGPGTAYTFDEYGDIITSSTYGSGKPIKTYTALEPRISLNVSLDEASSIKSSYTRTAQYLHLLSNSTTTNPSDLWIPSSNNIRPEYADQVSTGYFRNFEDNMYESSIEVYYKNMMNLIDFRNGADFQLNPTVESLLLTGRGWSYGMELLVRKKVGQLTGWVSYTLSRTMEQFPEIDYGQAFPARQDETHNIAIVGMYDLNDRWHLAATWVYNTGNAVTFPGGNYIVEGRLVPYYTSRNGYRMPAYHRLDVSVTHYFSKNSNLNFSVYNLYNRQNAYAITFRQVPNDPTRTEAVQYTLFPIIPSLTYNFNF